tara:strand:- start:6 stop:233 length:228 start_codon:yes stop_codon:yes gene_type:complete
MPGGEVIHLEIKSPSGKQSISQRNWQAEMERLGHRYLICRSVGELAEIITNWSKNVSTNSTQRPNSESLSKLDNT